MPDIYLALRFHVNFYHSYRGDSPDELGIGKDIRIIRRILDDLDRLNDQGIPVNGTWDIENHFSLSLIIPEYAPDILERLQSRVRRGLDEIEPMSWNNGLVSAQTGAEFRRTMEWTISNPDGSGISDLFEHWAPIVRPQECMFTPSHLAVYPEYGIRAVSLYYSSHPFNGFSNHVPLLSFDERYNPLTLSAPGFDSTMTLLPAYNDGDIAENFGLHAWLRYMRKKQKDRDLLLIIDMDADDTFWEGFGRLPSVLMKSAGGLYSMVKSVADLPYLRFIKPEDYLNTHEPAGSVSFGQDTADGSYDGLSSWAEKRENTRLWTGIQRSRLMDRWTDDAHKGRKIPAQVADSLEKALRFRLLAQSTTHFGMASPVMHTSRLAQAELLVEEACRASAEALADSKPEAAVPALCTPVMSSDGKWYLPFRSSARYRVPGEQPETRRNIDPNRTLVSGGLAFSLDDRGSVSFTVSGQRILNPERSRPSMRYNGKELAFRQVDFRPPMVVSDGLTGMTQTMVAQLPNKIHKIIWTGAFYTGDEEPWVLADIRVRYPQTPDRSGNREKEQRLMRSWDRGWQAIRPFELTPVWDASEPVRIWKRNAFGDLSFFDVPPGPVSSMNNQITDGWIAAAGGGRGLIIGMTTCSETNFAFCPVRVARGRSGELRLNPFGTYDGPQRKYAAARTGLARFLALRMADHLDSYAPSYNGEQQRITLLLIPYKGDRPPEHLTRIAEAFYMPVFPGENPWVKSVFPKSRVNYFEKDGPQ